ncbi:MAG: 50S ribosomal protein L22 [Minisyncoccia bacterium]|jgi:large subunit ribosomal protein L22
MDQILKTQLNHLKIPPRKVRLLADVIRGLTVQEAEAKLMLSPRRPKDALVKLLRSAVANAKNNHKLETDKLFVKEIRVDQGPKTGHWTPRSRGSAALIEKKTSHVMLVLGVMEKAKAPRFTIEKKKKPEKEEKKHKHEHAEKAEKAETLEKEKAKEAKKSDVKATAKTSGFRKFFQRKSI